MIPLTDSLVGIFKALSFFIAMFGLMMFAGAIEKRRPYRIAGIKSFVPVFISVVVMGLGTWGAIAVHDLGRPIARTVLGSVLLLFLSSLLFWLKVTALRIYAYLEMAFALVVSAQSMYSLGDVVEPIRLFGLLTAIYFMVRGMDNFKKDLDERRKQRPATTPAI